MPKKMNKEMFKTEAFSALLCQILTDGENQKGNSKMLLATGCSLSMYLRV